MNIYTSQLSIPCRQREQELAKAHKAELKSTASYHEQKTQLLLAEFNKAKDILTQEIIAAKEKYLILCIYCTYIVNLHADLKK